MLVSMICIMKVCSTPTTTPCLWHFLVPDPLPCLRSVTYGVELLLIALLRTGEGTFDDDSAKPSGAATPTVGDAAATEAGAKGRKGRQGKGLSKKAKTARQRLAIADASGDLGMGG